MSKRLELNERIIAGHRKIEQLKSIINSLQPGVKRDELGTKLIRMLFSLHALEDGFSDIYPGFCLYADAQCPERNNGCFPCSGCKEYINALYSEKQEQVRLI